MADTGEQQPASDAPEPPEFQAPTKDECTIAMFCHLLALVALLGIPFGSILGPLVIWLIKKDEYPLVNDQGKESLNFQITVTIVGIVCFFGSLFFIVIVPVFFFLTWLALIALGIYDLVFVIIASVKASSGEAYRYPFTLRLIK